MRFLNSMAELAHQIESKLRLFVEEGGLRDRGGRFAAGDAYYTEDGDFGECGPRDEDAVGVGIKVGRRDLDPVIQEREKVVGDDSLK